MAPAIDKKRNADLNLQRRWYADEVGWSAKLQSERLVKAFATVPREAFLGRGPWQILSPTQFVRGYTKTDDADPRHVSHNVLVAIDARRGLNNGHPSFLAALIDRDFRFAFPEQADATPVSRLQAVFLIADTPAP